MTRRALAAAMAELQRHDAYGFKHPTDVGWSQRRYTGGVVSARG
jgi:hypothetical protein